MKTLTILALVLSCASAFALTPAQMAGHFTNPKQVAMIGYKDAEACKADNGTWNDEYCVFPGEDTVDVTLKGGKFNLTIDVITTNAHSCSFDAAAKRVGDKVVASTKVQDYQDGKMVDAVCTVTVTYKNKNAITVGTNGKCQTFCGARAHMEFSANR